VLHTILPFITLIDAICRRHCEFSSSHQGASRASFLSSGRHWGSDVTFHRSTLYLDT
jgi:hypothetical protein